MLEGSRWRFVQTQDGFHDDQMWNRLEFLVFGKVHGLSKSPMSFGVSHGLALERVFYFCKGRHMGKAFNVVMFVESSINSSNLSSRWKLYLATPYWSFTAVNTNTGRNDYSTFSCLPQLTRYRGKVSEVPLRCQSHKKIHRRWCLHCSTFPWYRVLYSGWLKTLSKGTISGRVIDCTNQYKNLYSEYRTQMSSLCFILTMVILAPELCVAVVSRQKLSHAVSSHTKNHTCTFSTGSHEISLQMMHNYL
jgi:hypothetical protein